MTEVQPSRKYRLGVSRRHWSWRIAHAGGGLGSADRGGGAVRVCRRPEPDRVGISIGSGEWMLGPQAVGQFGFAGVGWVIGFGRLADVLHVECDGTSSRPRGAVLGWEVPQGAAFWVPFSVFVVIFAFIAGGWAAAAGQGLFALVNGRVAGPDEVQATRWFAIALLVLVFLITAAARKISRALELSNWVMVGTILLVLLVVDLVVVPWSVWWDGISGLITPAAPPPGITATQIGALAGFTLARA